MRALIVVTLLCLPAFLLPSCGRTATETDSAAFEATTTASTPSSTVPSPTDSATPPPRPAADEFVAAISNPYFPLAPGTTWIYEGETEDGFLRIEVRVTGETHRILDVECAVVVVSEYVDGEIVEQTVDWFAQDTAGNVWYMGEDVRDFEDGVVVSTEGSWKAGIDGAAPGIVMPAEPRLGELIVQEYVPGVAEDRAEVIALEVPVKLADGTEHICLQTKEWSPLDPEEVEYKYYAPGTGLVKESRIDGSEAIELVDFSSD